MNLVPIDKLIEMWARVHKEALDLSWWREACQCLRPTPEDDAILEDEAESVRIPAPKTSRIVLLTFS